MDDLNPRVVLWLKLTGLPAETLDRVNGEVRRVELDGTVLPWTLHYMLWIQRHWREYRKALGVSGEAFVSQDGFDAWLEAKVSKP